MAAVFTQWTALCLAVENQWGGAHSVDKANAVIQDVIDWFYARKGGGPAACSSPPHPTGGRPPPRPGAPLAPMASRQPQPEVPQRSQPCPLLRQGWAAETLAGRTLAATDSKPTCLRPVRNNPNTRSNKANP